MKELALVFGALLVGLGFYGFLNPVEPAKPAGDTTEQVAEGEEASDEKKTSKTALIPAIFGMPLIICGTLAFLGDNARKHAMHVAAGIALLGGVLALGRGLMKVNALFGDDPVSKRATMMVLAMGAICLVYVGLSVRSFIAARKAREAAEATESAG